MGRIDARGRFHPDDVPGLRRMVEDLREGREPLDHPASLFGPWREFGSYAQAALRWTVENDIKRTMDFFPHGDLWTGLVRGAWDLDRFLHEHSALPRVRPAEMLAALGRRPQWLLGNSPRAWRSITGPGAITWTRRAM